MDCYKPSLTGIISTALPVELVSKIWSFMSITQLLLYASTSSVNYDDVHNGIRDSVHRVLGHFCTDTMRFLAMLYEQRACVSGSVVVHVMHGVNFKGGAGVENKWFPKDIDVYVPRPRRDDIPPEMVTYMVEVEGYREVDSPALSNSSNYSLNPEIKNMIVLRKGQLRMDVVMSASPISLMPVLRFHSTFVMNCITGHGIWSAYPGKTCAGRGICNPMVFCLDNITPRQPPASVRAAYHKYAERGFDIRKGPGSWSDDLHICTKHGCCPHTFRSVEDWSCLYVSLRTIGEDSGIGSRKSTVSDEVSIEDAQVVWLLGGRACDGRRPGLKGYVTYRGEYVG